VPSLLPPNATPLERNVEALTERLEVLPPNFETMWDADHCAIDLLPWLAWAFSVDEWDADWSEAQKRKAIKDSKFIHKHKGTRAAVERALSALPFDTNLVEWFEQHPPSDPYTFLIQSSLFEMSANDAETLMRVVNAAKNLRSHYVLETEIYIDGDIYCGGAVMSGQEVEIFYQGYEP
jgi:phage tail P2-like protein